MNSLRKVVSQLSISKSLLQTVQSSRNLSKNIPSVTNGTQNITMASKTSTEKLRAKAPEENFNTASKESLFRKIQKEIMKKEEYTNNPLAISPGKQTEPSEQNKTEVNLKVDLPKADFIENKSVPCVAINICDDVTSKNIFKEVVNEKVLKNRTIQCSQSAIGNEKPSTSKSSTTIFSTIDETLAKYLAYGLFGFITYWVWLSGLTANDQAPKTSPANNAAIVSNSKEVNEE